MLKCSKRHGSSNLLISAFDECFNLGRWWDHRKSIRERLEGQLETHIVAELRNRSGILGAGFAKNFWRNFLQRGVVLAKGMIWSRSQESARGRGAAFKDSVEEQRAAAAQRRGFSCYAGPGRGSAAASKSFRSYAEASRGSIRTASPTLGLHNPSLSNTVVRRAYQGLMLGLQG